MNYEREIAKKSMKNLAKNKIESPKYETHLSVKLKSTGNDDI